MSEFQDAFGISLDESMSAMEQSSNYLRHPRALIALLALASGAPMADRASRDALNSAWLHLLSKAGQDLAVLNHREGHGAGFRGFVDSNLLNPISWADPSHWALFFAVRSASDGLQVDTCPSPTSESHLTGILLGAIESQCETWRQAVSAPLARSGTSLSLHKLDLSILGGEQVTGGDFGIVLDFRIKATGHRRIVPLVFQAKRFVRPEADVSQYHEIRGFQREQLARNSCAASYIFYENGTKPLANPVPPLVKPVGLVGPQNRTSAIEGTVELATYLVTALTVPGATPDAGDPNEALRMIYKRNTPSFLAIISDDETASMRYAAQLSHIADLIRRDGDAFEFETVE